MKKLKINIFIILVFCSMLVFCMYTESANQDQQLSFVYGLTTEPDHLDPFQATSADSRLVLFNIFEGLLKPNHDGTLVPAVAKEYNISKDFKTYTFIIRDVKFHNGQKVTSSDVKYSIEKAKECKFPGMDNISSVETVDGKTVRVILNTPDSDFASYFTMAIVPNDYTEQNSHPIGTGPFAFKSFTPQQSLIFVKNKDYWNPALPKMQQVTFKIKTDAKTLLMDLQAGSIDAGTLDSTTARQLNLKKFYLEYSNSNSVQMMALNNNSGPLKDIRVRQAISYAVDAEEIMKLVHGGHAVRAGTPVIPAIKKYFDASLNNAYTKNINKAKQLLKEAGLEKGFKMTITVPSNYQMHVETAQVAVNQLSKINITADIKQVDWPTWISEVYMNRKYEATIISVDGITVSPRSFLNRYVSAAPGNFVNYSSQEYDNVYNKALKATDETERIKHYKEAQKILSKDAASVFLDDLSNIIAFRKGLKGFQSYPCYVFDASVIYAEK